MIRRLASLLGVLALALAAALPSLSSEQIDPDYWWHVLLGRQLNAGGSTVAPDDISYATVRTPYRRHSWGADRLMAAVDERAGIEGYRVARALLRGATAAVVALGCLRAGRSRLVSLALAALILPFLWWLQEFRPIAMAHVLLAAAAGIHVGRGPPPGALAGAATLAIAAVLSSIHPTAFVVVVWLGAIFAGAQVEALAARDAAVRAGAARRAAFYLRLGAGALLALALDPEPMGAIRSAFFLRADAMASGRYISEWLAPQAAGWIGWLGIWIGLAALAALARSRRARLDEAVLLAGMLYIGLDLARNTILLAFVALPLLARHLPRGPRPWRIALARGGRRPGLCLALGVAVLAATAAVSIPASRPAAPLQTDPIEAAEASGYPARAADWALANVTPRSGRALTLYTVGGYVAYRVWPKFQVFQYGQNQLYPEEFWPDFTQHRVEGMRRRLLDPGPDFAILPNLPPDLAGAWEHLLTEAGWTIAFRKGGGIVMVPPGR